MFLATSYSVRVPRLFSVPYDIKDTSVASRGPEYTELALFPLVSIGVTKIYLFQSPTPVLHVGGTGLTAEGHSAPQPSL